MNTELGFLLRAIQAAPKARQLTVRHLAALLHLADQSAPIRSREIAATICIPKPSITRLLIYLCALKLITRRRGLKDKRDCMVEITPEGREFIAKVLPNIPQARAA